MVSQQKCVTQMMSLRTGDNSYDIPWMFYFLSSYVTVCTSWIHWKFCRCWYCFYPIIFSAKYKLSMLNYFAAVIVWKTARWDYETIAEWWNSKVKRTCRFLKKSVPTKIHIQTIDRKNMATRNKKHLNWSVTTANVHAKIQIYDLWLGVEFCTSFSFIYDSHRQGTDAPATGAANIGGPLTWHAYSTEL